MPDRRYKDQYWYAKSKAAVSRVLKSIRDVEGITQADLAKEILTTQSAVSDLEKGESDPQITTLFRFAEACGCDVEIVITRKQRLQPYAQWIITSEGTLQDE